uniref:Uncharacterized protein n=1 Tax=Timema cristinae TaxID=61476 RepID=A0A7R9HBK7_TIMCR|nr:unnamed protein product [Timema cristinae]
MKFFNRLLQIFLTLHTTGFYGFYLPGLAPVNYCKEGEGSDTCKSEVMLYVNRLNTEESVIPYEYHQRIEKKRLRQYRHGKRRDSKEDTVNRGGGQEAKRKTQGQENIEWVEVGEERCFDFCPTDETKSPVENLGQVVFGERIRPSPYKASTLTFWRALDWKLELL